MLPALQTRTDEKGYRKSTHMLLRVCLLPRKPLQQSNRYGLLLPVPQQNLLGTREQHYMLQKNNPLPRLDRLVRYFPAPPLRLWGCAHFFHQCNIH